MPVPPYHKPHYWEAAYQSFGPEDSVEWGSISLADLSKYEYQILEWDSSRPQTNATISTTLGKTLSVEPNGEEEPILMLGCGNSKLGEDMIQEGWTGPIIQVDVSSRVIESMSQRCASLITNGHMNFIEDDATELSAFRSGMMNCCLDKGLMDAIYCADELDQCRSILSNVNRVLKHGGIFAFLSYSRPEFLLPAIAPNDGSKPKWESIQVQGLESIILYRFKKVAKSERSKISTKEKRR
ncbi:unnamed protein product [Cylindrotheca closterium]|uniref:Methyltransferase domain-containing protein n=1 Tax=Cylindrotheca closterium TaxID=2856 RepID=A0AAD2CUE4_9STRA|nr:unnamed protein product [Cylindrotheca closterium]